MVVHPFDRQRAVDSLFLGAKLRRWFYCNYLVATSRKLCGVAARARSYVKHCARLDRKQVQQVSVDLSESDALVL